MNGTRVTCEDQGGLGASESVVIRDNYVLVTDGTCEQTYVQVSQASDGSFTHVITVKGCRKHPAESQ